MLPFLARSFVLIAAAIGFAAVRRRRARSPVMSPRLSANELRGESLRPPASAPDEHAPTPTPAERDRLLDDPFVARHESQSVDRAFSSVDTARLSSDAEGTSPSSAAADVPAEAQGLSQAAIPAPPGPLETPRHGRPDNLTLISGIGPSIERLLFENGIFHFDQIAGWSDEDARRIDALTGFSGRVARENWRPQARRFMAKRGGEG